MEDKTLLKEIEQIKEVRSLWAMGDAIRDEGLCERTDLRKVCNIPYCDSKTKEEEIWHLMDLYYPKETDQKKGTKYPVIVSIHGGGWFYGDKELYRFYTMDLSRRGFAVVNFNYRLCPEYKYPGGFSDVCRLLDFLKKNADKYQLDLENLFLVGDSAGAQLASQYSIFATSKEYRKLFAFSDEIEFLVPKKVALNCGIYDMQERLKAQEELCGHYLPKDLSKELFESFEHVLDYMNDSFPETYLMCSVNDPLRVHTPAMLKRLMEHNISYMYREFGKEKKEDGHVFHVNLKSQNGQICNDETAAFFLS